MGRRESGLMDWADDLAITIIADAHGYTYSEARARIAARLREIDRTSRALAGTLQAEHIADVDERGFEGWGR